MTYEVLTTLKVKTLEGVRDIEPGEIITLPESVALRLLEGGRVKPYDPDCFSGDGTLESLISQARVERWTDNKLLPLIYELIHGDTLEAPWGFRVHDTPLVAGGVYWIISDTMARHRVPVEAISFTIAELKPLMEISRVFRGAMAVKVIKDDSDANKN